MIKGAIINKGEDRYTSFKKIFKALNNFQKDYNWLITDCEACPEKWGHEERMNYHMQMVMVDFGKKLFQFNIRLLQ